MIISVVSTLDRSAEKIAKKTHSLLEAFSEPTLSTSDCYLLDGCLLLVSLDPLLPSSAGSASLEAYLGGQA